MVFSTHLLSNCYLNKMNQFDITILTDHRYVNESKGDTYAENVFLEDNLLKIALEKIGIKVYRTNWDDPSFDWSSTRYILFRTTWDYFDRFDEFSTWLEKVSKLTRLINPKELIYWNIDKHYLQDISKSRIRIPNTIFLEPGEQRSLTEISSELNWKEFILKPAISGAARHTYRYTIDEAPSLEKTFAQLIAKESMLIQEFQTNILTKGEVAYMVFGGRFSHAILKKAKQGDFRVQDDFGGTVHPYTASEGEIAFAEKVVSVCDPVPLQARVDFIWDLVYFSTIALWTQNDARTRKLYQPYEFGYFVFLFWPLILPYQLVKTRGMEGLMRYLGFISLYFIPPVAGHLI